jgi:hypothetical protein
MKKSRVTKKEMLKRGYVVVKKITTKDWILKKNVLGVDEYVRLKNSNPFYIFEFFDMLKEKIIKPDAI